MQNGFEAYNFAGGFRLYSSIKDILPPSGGTVRMQLSTNLYSSIREYVSGLFSANVARQVPIRRLGINFFGLADESSEGYDLFTDFDKVQTEKKLEQTVLGIKDRFGKNAVFRGIDLSDGATAIARNKMIGGHNGE
jgi:DNA polymerase V